MKNNFTLLKTTIVLCLIFLVQMLFATNYTFSVPISGANWTNPARWSPSYPGTNIGSDDVVNVVGFAGQGFINTDIVISGTLINTSILRVHSDNTLTINNGGEVENKISLVIDGTMVVQSGGDFIQDGAAVGIYGTLNSTGNVTVNIDKKIIIGDGGTFNQNGSLTNNGTLEIDTGGELVLDTSPATLPNGLDWKNGGTITIGSSGNLTHSAALAIESNRTLQLVGTMTIASGNQLTLDGTLYVNPTGNLKINNASNLTVNGNGTLNLDGDLRINSNSTLTNNGAIDLNTGGLLFINSANATWPVFNWNGGTLRFSSNTDINLSANKSVPSDRVLEIIGGFTINSGFTLTNDGALTNEGNLNLNGNLTNNGSLDNENGTMTMELGSELILNTDPASLPGGTFNWNAGKVTVDASGHLTLTNSLTLDSDKILEIKGALTNNSTFKLNTGGELILNADPINLPSPFIWDGGQVTISSNGHLTLNSSLSLSSGETLEVRGTLTINSGNISGSGDLDLHAGGDLILNANPAYLPSSSVFNWNGGDIIIGPDGHLSLFSTTLSSGKRLIVKGTLNSNGNLTVGGELRVESNGDVNNNGSVNIIGSGRLRIFGSGLFENNNILSLDVYNPTNILSSGTLNLNSGSEMILKGFEAWPTFSFNWKGGSRVTLSSGTLTLSNSLTISSGQKLRVNNTLVIPSGKVLTNNGTLNLHGNLINDRTLHNNGNLTIKGSGTLTNNSIFNNNSPLTVNGTLNNNDTFNNNSTMVGNGTFNGNHFNNSTLAPGTSPGCFTFGDDFTNTGTLDIELTDGGACTDFDQIVVDGDATIGGIVNITFPSGIPSTTTFAILTATGVKIDNSPTINWPAGFSGTGAFVGNEYQVSFSVLPVELIYFYIEKKENNSVELKWETASESNNRGFELQRSTDGMEWENIGFVNGAGTTTEKQYYSFTDRPDFSGLFYYRLRQMDFDGQFEYSQIRSVELKNINSEIKIYPNPAGSYIYLNIENDWEGEMTIRILNSIGQEIYTSIFSKNIKEWNGQINLSEMPGGIYRVIISNGENMMTKPIVKQ